MLKMLVSTLKERDKEINKIVNSIHECLLDLNKDFFNPLVRYSSNYGDFIIHIDLIFYNRNVSSFHISYNENEENYKIFRKDHNTSEYNTNGDKIPVLDKINQLEKQLNKLLKE